MAKEKAILNRDVHVSEIFDNHFDEDDMVTFEEGTKVTVLKRYVDKTSNLPQSVIFSKKLGEATVVGDIFLDFIEKEENTDF